MKTFKEWVLVEVSAQKASKDFETHIVNLAVLSKKITNIKKLETLIDKNQKLFTGIDKKHKTQTIEAVVHLNNYFKKVWTGGYNANFSSIPKPIYGNKSAKADIILESGSKKYGISVKMKGDYVVVSAQNKEEFESIFYSALNEFEKQKGINLSDYESGIESIREKVKLIKDNVIGETLTRHLSPTHFSKLENKSREEHKIFYEDLRNTIESRNKEINNDYEKVLNGIAKESESTLNNLLSDNELLRNYIVWEALSASIKYKGKLPFAEYVLSPNGCYDILSPESTFVQKVASASTIGIRGMVHGKLRSSASKALAPYVGQSSVEMNELYDTLNKMDMSLKWDLSETKFKELKIVVDSQNEGIFSDLWNVIKKWWGKIKTIGEEAIKKSMGIADGVMSKLTELKRASIFDILKFNKPKITGTIKLP